MREWLVDLYSDTKTRPSPAMRTAMAQAAVGDEQQGEDVTVQALNERVAAMLGKEAALFLPSGTMANLVSILVHCGRGDEIICEASSHIRHYETGGPASIGGATISPIAGTYGIFTVEAAQAALRPERWNSPRPRLLWIEQTTNLGGGGIWPLATLRSLQRLAQAHKMALHIDGARLLNASVAMKLSPAAYGQVADSLWLDFTKGLGAPFGAVLAGSRAFIDQARRYKHMLGGAMRQAGMMAAGCLYALDHNVERLAEDHAHARLLATGLTEIPGFVLLNVVETNIIIVDVKDTGKSAQEIYDILALSGVRVGVFGPTTLRLITHLDISKQQIEMALNAMLRITQRVS